jgi:hypothetical protein
LEVGEDMGNKKEKHVSGLTSAEVKQIAEQIFCRTDSNHPQLKKTDNGFLDILRNGKPNISASSVFIKKVSL